MKYFYLTFVFILVSCSNSARHDSDPISSVKKISDLSEIITSVNKLEPQSVLVVLDIDDTLLTSREFFGSDKWYDWQRGKGKDKNDRAVDISDDMKAPCMFDILGITFEIGTNKLAQENEYDPESNKKIKENTLDIVKRIDTDILVLTARSEKYRASTHRELVRNGFDFSENHLYEAMPVRFKVKEGDKSAYVSYIDGVFMVSGMNKGNMLIELLDRIEKDYDVVIFVDDKLKNINNMKNALYSHGEDLYAFHYTKINKAISQEDVRKGNESMIQLLAFMEENFKHRAKSIMSNECSY